jgi:cytochrome c
MKTFGLAVMVTALLAGSAVAEETGDAEAGKQVFAKCAVCHNIGPDAKNKVGPALTGVIGRQPGTFPGFNYSAAMKKFGEDGKIWTPELLATYLKAPRDVVPGTRMAFAGLKDQTDEDNLIAYLLTFSPDYVPADAAAAPADGAAPAATAPAQ